ncbi:putative stress responsive A/B Barrel domain-containing protein [Colletotrichum sublineola]|uniref:Putative stress responsive A/B Barrel domain-containing protein n=1 Tax=Colletotrichum sublineola TaxID=1173701 RepID=A0A066XKH9_COLSU|nr:putative stress responsive A/B Barrel domain-containing protein [Colletotrichum sublineola]
MQLDPLDATSDAHRTATRLSHNKNLRRHDGSTYCAPVLFKFRPDVSEEHRETFVRELKTLKSLPCVKDHRLIVGGPSVTDPLERSKGYHFALLSFHQDCGALEEYQASAEHHSTYLWPFKEDVTRFDFEVAEEDEYMCQFVARGLANGNA